MACGPGPLTPALEAGVTTTGAPSSGPEHTQALSLLGLCKPGSDPVCLRPSPQLWGWGRRRSSASQGWAPCLILKASFSPSREASARGWPLAPACPHPAHSSFWAGTDSRPSVRVTEAQGVTGQCACPCWVSPSPRCIVREWLWTPPLPPRTEALSGDMTPAPQQGLTHRALTP